MNATTMSQTANFENSILKLIHTKRSVRRRRKMTNIKRKCSHSLQLPLDMNGPLQLTYGESVRPDKVGLDKCFPLCTVHPGPEDPVLEAPVGEVHPPLSVPRIQHNCSRLEQVRLHYRGSPLRVQIHHIDPVCT